MIKFEIDELRKLLKDFYSLTQMKICVFDRDLKEIACYPVEPNDLCSLVKSTVAGNKLCEMSDQHAFNLCKKGKTHHIYKCPMGFVEAVTPIVVNDIIAGYIMLGKVIISSDELLQEKEQVNETRKDDNVQRTLAQDDDKISSATSLNIEMIEKSNLNYTENMIDEISSNAKKLGISENLIAEKLAQVKPVSVEKIFSASHILDTCASYLYLSKQVNITADNIMIEINHYIKSHIAEKIDVNTLCNEFLLSRVSLYSLFHQNYHSTVAEYVKNCRLNYAKELLVSTTMQIKEVADKIGQDYNYFSKVFSKSVGMSPKQFRLKNLL